MYCISRCVRFPFSGFLVSLVLLATCADCGEVERSRVTAGLGLNLSVYREGAGFPFTAWKMFTKEEAAPALEDSTVEGDLNSYGASAGIRCTIKTQDFGNISAGVGYTYRVEKLMQSFASILGKVKQEIADNSYPYTEARWETSSLLGIRNLEVVLSAVAGGEELGTDKVLPLRVTGGIGYRISNLTRVYAGLQYTTHLQFASLKSAKLTFSESAKPVVGIELST